MNVKLESSWLELLADQFEQPYFKKIKDFLLKEDVHSAAHFLRADFRGHELQFLTPHINFPFHSSCTSLQNKWVSLPIGIKKAIVALKWTTEGKVFEKIFGMLNPSAVIRRVSALASL